MACGAGCGCRATSNGLPLGCKNNGSCGTGGCNKLNTFDWFADLTLPPNQKKFGFAEISFKNGVRKGFYKNSKNLELNTGDYVEVETATGKDLGEITLSGELVRLQMKKKKVNEDSDDIKTITRKANDRDLKTLEEVRSKEKPTLIKARVISRDLGLEMKIGDVEYQADKKKATFYYTAEERVDFRELIKLYAKEFKVKIEMRQIGDRQMAGLIGGIGDCGRELCCATWLTDFKTVSTTAARYQSLAINQAKLSGQCGRLKCCLNYELDTYLEALEEFPENAEKLETKKGEAKLIKRDILKFLMHYIYEGSGTTYKLNTKRVKEILEMNSQGEKPSDLAEDDQSKLPETVHSYGQDAVGHISLATLEKKRSKKSKKNRYRR